MVATKPPPVEEETDTEFLAHKARFQDLQQQLTTTSQQVRAILLYLREGQHILCGQSKQFVVWHRKDFKLHVNACEPTPCASNALTT